MMPALSKKSNVVLFCTDQLRFDALSCTGNSIVNTPNIDRIAQNGVSFTNHITPCQICAPSRASMFTGLYPRHHGLTRNGVALDPSYEHLTHVMMENGVRTYGVGKFHFQPILASAAYGMPESNAFWSLPESEDWRGPFYGFQNVDLVIGESFTSTRGGHYGRWLEREHPGVADLYLPENGLDFELDEMDEVWRSAVPAELHYNSWIAGQATDFVARTDKDNPFFLFVSFPDPHHPFSPPAPYCDMFDPAEMPEPAYIEGELDAMPSYISKETWTDGFEGDISYKDFLAEGKFAIEQGTWQKTSAFSIQSMHKIIAYTHAMVKMIDDCVGRVLSSLDARGLAENTIVIFTSDHGELLGDHGLIRKGPMPYRQLLQIPLVMSGPGIPKGQTLDALTSHLDIKETLLDLLGLQGRPTDGTSLVPLLDGSSSKVRDTAFAEYFPRSVPNQYNQTILSGDMRLTLYPKAEEHGWGELFDHSQDPGEHKNLYQDAMRRDEIAALTRDLERNLPLQADMPQRILGFY